MLRFVPVALTPVVFLLVRFEIGEPLGGSIALSLAYGGLAALQPARQWCLREPVTVRQVVTAYTLPDALYGVVLVACLSLAWSDGTGASKLPLLVGSIALAVLVVPRAILIWALLGRRGERLDQETDGETARSMSRLAGRLCLPAMVLLTISVGLWLFGLGPRHLALGLALGGLVGLAGAAILVVTRPTHSKNA